jgi:hypothetical protein
MTADAAIRKLTYRVHPAPLFEVNAGEHSDIHHLRRYRSSATRPIATLSQAQPHHRLWRRRTSGFAEARSLSKTAITGETVASISNRHEVTEII